MSGPRSFRRLFEWRLTASRIAGIYAVLGALWILLSDSLLETLVKDPAVLTRLQTYKGWFYVLVTALLLYALIHRSTATLRRSEENLRERTRELETLQGETQRERNWLQVLVDTAPIGIIRYSAPDGRLLLFNRAAEAILGRPVVPYLTVAHEPAYFSIRRPDGEPFPPEDLAASCALRGDICIGVEAIMDQPSGRRVYTLANSAPIHDAKGEIIGAVVAFQDITAIREQQRLREEFISTAAHELKTPVTAIKGYVQMMRKWTPDGRELREQQAIDVIDSQCDRISWRVQEMLEVVRTRLTPLELARTRFNLDELAARVVQRMKDTKQLPNLVLERQSPAPVEADRARIEEVLVSLVENALWNSPKDGEIQVRVWVREGDAIVSVSDHGVGIPDERRQHVFEPFYEAVPPGAPGYRGVISLGLYLSKLTVEHHKGRIWFDTDEGKGSTFYLSLPSIEGGDGSLA